MDVKTVVRSPVQFFACLGSFQQEMEKALDVSFSRWRQLDTM
jgi:hypothetical protein